MAQKQGGDQCANLLGLFWKIKNVAFMKIVALWNVFAKRCIFSPSRNLRRWEILSNMSITGEICHFLASWVGHRYFFNMPYLHSFFYELWSLFSQSHQTWQGRGELVHIFILGCLRSFQCLPLHRYLSVSVCPSHSPLASLIWPSVAFITGRFRGWFSGQRVEGGLWW